MDPQYSDSQRHGQTESKKTSPDESHTPELLPDAPLKLMANNSTAIISVHAIRHTGSDQLHPGELMHSENAGKDQQNKEKANTPK